MKIYINTALPRETTLAGHTVSGGSYDEFLRNKCSIKDIVLQGVSNRSLFARLRNPEYLHELYYTKDPDYLRYLHSFKEKYWDYDVIVMNPGVDLVHPEFLHKHFSGSLKILHFIDDPHMTYSYCLPFAWAFNGATYISPSYSEDYRMSELLQLAGFRHVRWVPHCVSNLHEPKWSMSDLPEQLYKRSKAIYIGSYYSGKNDRLCKMKHLLGSHFDIFGRFPWRGYSFGFFSTIKGYPSLYRVRAVSNSERESLYEQYAVGVNLHLSTPAVETGNARLYELAYRGVAQVVDTSRVSLVREIFEPDREILTYETVEECVAKVNYLLANVDYRTSLALNAYQKACNRYQYKSVLLELFDWFSGILTEERRASCQQEGASALQNG